MKNYEFHPLAEDYPLMPAFELGRLEQGMRQAGFDPRFPIVLYQKKILDGRNRYLAAEKAGVKPLFVTFKGSEEEAEFFVRLANEERRHLAQDWLQRRRQERMDRVAQRREAGESERTIAEAEDISRAQVKRDLAETQLGRGGPVEPKDGKVTGKDGKTHPAQKNPPTASAAAGPPGPAETPHVLGNDGVSSSEKGKKPSPILCDRCKRVGRTKDCQACKIAREEAKKEKGKAAANGKAPEPPPEPEPSPTDDLGIPIQPHAMEVFKVRELFDKALKLLREARRVYNEAASSPGGAYLIRPGVSVNARDSWKHKGIETAILTLLDCRPSITVCPYAHNPHLPHGDDCPLCHGMNWSRKLGKDEAGASLIPNVKEAFGV